MLRLCQRWLVGGEELPHVAGSMVRLGSIMCFLRGSHGLNPLTGRAFSRSVSQIASFCAVMVDLTQLAHLFCPQVADASDDEEFACLPRHQGTAILSGGNVRVSGTQKGEASHPYASSRDRLTLAGTYCGRGHSAGFGVGTRTGAS